MLFFETQRHGGTEREELGLGLGLRVLCDSVFPKFAQWMARGLILFFETQRHGGTERKALGFRTEAQRGRGRGLEALEE
jgi:hypothetical protein